MSKILRWLSWNVIRAAIGYGLTASLSMSAFADDYNMSMPTDFQMPGIGSLRDYQKGQDNEVVDPFTGALKITYTDLYMPLNGSDLSLSVIRTYSSLQNSSLSTLNPYAASSAFVSPIGGRTLLGLGWDLHFGRVWVHMDTNALGVGSCQSLNGNTGSWSPVLELQDGTRKVLYNDGSNPNQLVTKDFWVGRCLSGGGIEITSPQGLVYTFDMRGYVSPGDNAIPLNGYNNKYPYVVTKIRDKNGNELDFNYTQHYFNNDTATPDYLLLDSIGGTFGQIASFTYTNTSTIQWSWSLTGVRLSSGQTVSYTLVPAPTGDPFDATKPGPPQELSNVHLPDGTNWSYQYFDFSSQPSSGYGWYSLSNVTSPSGVQATYQYGTVNFAINSDITQQLYNVVVQQKSSSGASIQPGTWTYTYSPGSASGYDVTTASYSGSVTSLCTKYLHLGDTYVSSGGVTDNPYLYQLGLLKEKMIYSGTSCSGTPVRDEQYMWGSILVITGGEHDYRPPPELAISLTLRNPVLTELNVLIDGQSHDTQYSNFNSVGQPMTIVESGSGGTRNTTLSYDSGTGCGGGLAWRQFQRQNETIDNSGSILRSFDSCGRPNQITTNGVAVDYRYDSYGDVNLKTYENGAKTLAIQMTGYVGGTPANISYGTSGKTISRILDARGNITQETISQNGLSTTTGYSYDSLDRLLSITTPKTNDNDISISYATGNGYTVTKIRGNFKETQTFDGHAALLSDSQVDKKGQTIKKTYTVDDFGRTTFASYPYLGAKASGSIATTYDVLGRMLSQGSTVNDQGTCPCPKMTFINNGDNVTVTDELLHTTTYTYNSYGKPEEKYLVKISAPQNQLTSIQRNSLGRIDSVTQTDTSTSSSIIQFYTYIPTRPFQLYTESRPETGTTVYGRDLLGNMTARTVGSSPTTTFTYNVLNQLTDINYPSPTPDLHYTYTNVGKIWTQYTTDASGEITRDAFAYDANNNVKTETVTGRGLPANGYAFTYGYDGNDALASLTYPNGEQATYAPDAFGRATNLQLAYVFGATSPVIYSVANSITYFADGAINAIARNDANTETFTETARQLPLQMQLYPTAFGTANDIANITYQYDAVKNVTGIIDPISSNSISNVQYDGLDRLKTATGIWGTFIQTSNARGDILTKSILGSTNKLTYSYDPTSKQLLSVSDGISINYGFSYDAYGNTAFNGRQHLNFDDADHLRSITESQVSYDYDAKDRRMITTDVSGNKKFSIYGANDQLLYEASNDGSNNYTDYLYAGSHFISRNDHCASSSPDYLQICSWWQDSDGDGLSDWYEQNISHTCPYVGYVFPSGVNGPNCSSSALGAYGAYSTNGSGISDGVLVAAGLNPLDPNSNYSAPLVNLYMPVSSSVVLPKAELLANSINVKNLALSITGVSPATTTVSKDAMNGTDIKVTSTASGSDQFRYTLVATGNPVTQTGPVLVNVSPNTSSIYGTPQRDFIVSPGNATQGAVVDAGAGNDVIFGNPNSNSVYLQDKFDGNDHLYINTANAKHSDIVNFSSNVDPHSVNAYLDGPDLVLDIRRAQSTITAYNSLGNILKNGITAVNFSYDNSSWDLENKPVAVDDHIVTATDTSGTLVDISIDTLLKNDLIPQGIELSLDPATGVSNAVNGSASVVTSFIGSYIQFVLSPGMTSGSFTYTLTDPNGVIPSTSANVSFTVTGTGTGVAFNSTDDDLILNGTVGDDTFTISNVTYPTYNIVNGVGGKDTVYFNKGAGKATYYYLADDGGTDIGDTIHFVSLARTDVSLFRQGVDLVAQITGTGDSIRLQDYFLQEVTVNPSLSSALTNGLFPFRQVIFDGDNTALSAQSLASDGITVIPGSPESPLALAATANATNGCTGIKTIPTCLGTSGNDTIKGSSGGDIIYGGDGNDTLIGNNGDDTLYGGEGNDYLQGNGGNDALYGDGGVDWLDPGNGTNFLSGGAGVDYYLIDQNSGSSTIDNFDLSHSGVRDIIWFKSLKPAQVTFARNGNGSDLIITVTKSGTTSKTTILNYFDLVPYNETDFDFGGATPSTTISSSWDGDCTDNVPLNSPPVANSHCVKDRVLADMAANDTKCQGLVLFGYDSSDSIVGGCGPDIIYGGKGVDTLHGGKGNDTLYPYWGSDAVYGDDGNDSLWGTYLFGYGTLTGGNGSDSYIFGDNNYGYVDASAPSDPSSGVDRIQMVGTLSPQDYWLFTNANGNLIIGDLEGDGTYFAHVTVLNWQGPANELGYIEVGQPGTPGCQSLSRANFQPYMNAIAAIQSANNDPVGAVPTGVEIQAAMASGSYWTACGSF